jgi:glycosyltransferase involved in cell wall biosynthesis
MTLRRRRLVRRSKENVDIKLSILIPTLFTRRLQFNRITEKLMKQINENNYEKEIEIIAHYDNKTVGLSEKRTNMLLTSCGEYIAFLDDDDDISDNYIKLIMKTIKENNNIDVITFKQHCNIDGKKFNLVSSIKYDLNMNNYDKKSNTYFRYPWIWCVWKSNKVKDLIFEDPTARKNYGEDGNWLKKIKETDEITKEICLDEVLHYYLFSSEKTETQK